MENKQMVLFPETSSLDSEKLRFLRATKAKMKDSGNSVESMKICVEAMNELIAFDEQFWGKCEMILNGKGLLEYFIDNASPEMVFNLQRFLGNVYEVIDSAIYSAEFHALETYRTELTGQLQQQIKELSLENATINNTTVDSALVQFLVQCSYNLPSMLYRLYRERYPHYQLKK